MATKLYATPLSHFARKIRILLAELDVPHEIVYVKNLLSTDPADFGGNPILKIPTLVDEEQWVVESDLIARYLVERHDPEDRLRVHSMNANQRNVLSMINAAMAAEVELILSARSGIEGVESIPFFQRYAEAIELCLDWLEKEGKAHWTEELGYLDIALACMWDHLVHYERIPEGKPYDWLKARVAQFAARPAFESTAPINQKL